jgi:hypothetical protein
MILPRLPDPGLNAVLLGRSERTLVGYMQIRPGDRRGNGPLVAPGGTVWEEALMPSDSPRRP